jgi:hypothetical protein
MSNRNSTLGEKGVCTQPLYRCPLCKRSGYSAQGLRTHRCPELPPTTMQSPRGEARQYRARLPLDLIDRVIAAGPINGGAR